MKAFLQSLLDLFTFCLTVITVWLIIRYPCYVNYFFLLFGVSLLLAHISEFLFFEILILFGSIFIGILSIYFLPSSNNMVIIGEMVSFILWYLLLLRLDEIREKQQVSFFENRENLEKRIGEIKYNINYLRTEIQKNLGKIQNYKIIEEIINKLASFTSFEEINSYLSEIFVKLFPWFVTYIYIEGHTKQIEPVLQKLLTFLEKDSVYVSDLSTYLPFLKPYQVVDFYRTKEYLLKNGINSFVCVRFRREKENEDLGYLVVYSKHKIEEEDFRLILLLSSYIEIAISNVKLYESIKELAITDSLTGLYVQRYFKELLTEKLKMYKYYKKSLSMAMFDIDNFKQINDTYGHNIGDEVLVKFANILTTRLRETDIIARYGGDEFIVVFPNTDLSNAINICEEIRNLVMKETIVVSKNITSMKPGLVRIKFFVSCGVSSYSESFSTAEEFIDYVDRLLYKAKQSGKNKVVWG
jgi:diguanylate cyclase (GGDEF)-like protein